MTDISFSDTMMNKAEHRRENAYVTLLSLVTIIESLSMKDGYVLACRLTSLSREAHRRGRTRRAEIMEAIVDLIHQTAPEDLVQFALSLSSAKAESDHDD